MPVPGAAREEDASVPRYIAVQFAKLSLPECFRILGRHAPRWLLHRALGALPRQGATIAVETFADCEVSADDIPAEERAPLDEFVAAAGTLGFHDPLFTRAQHEVSRSASVTLRDTSGLLIARRDAITPRASGPRGSAQVVGGISPDGRAVQASDQRKVFDDIPGQVVLSRPGASLAELRDTLERHAATTTADALTPVFTDAEAVRRIVDAHVSRSIDERVRRGTYREVDPPLELDDSEAGQDAAFERAVLGELDQPTPPAGKWRNTVAVALLSLALFIVVGGLHWSWTIAAIIAGVVVVHELGHFVLMRLFGYQNLRMFFIPLLGAAVTGRAHAVSAWKKAVVSLAGPVPGIAIAWILLAIIPEAPFSMRAVLGQIAVVSFILNGINLLPFLPLDGGWVIDSLLMRAHPRAEVVVRIAAAFGLVATGIWLDSTVIWALSVLSLVGLRDAWSLAPVTNALRTEGLPPAEPGPPIPHEPALHILRRVRAALPAPQAPTVLAMHVRSIHERLTIPSPHAMIVVVLLLLHVAAGGAAVVGLGAAKEARDDASVNATRQALIEDWGGTPARPWTGGEVEGDALDATRLVVAHCADETAARAAHARLRSLVAGGERVTRFGSTLLVATDAARAAAWARRLDRTRRVLRGTFTKTLDERVEPVVCRLACEAPSAERAARMASLIELSLQLASAGLRPEWLPVPDSVDPATRQAEARTRATWLRFNELKINRMPFMDDLDPELINARARVVDELAASGDPEIDPEMLRLLLERKNESIESADWSRRGEIFDAILDRAGRIDPDTPGLPFTGGAEAHGATVEIEAMIILRPDLGLPPLADWLAAQGCTGIRYEIVAGPDFGRP